MSDKNTKTLATPGETTSKKFLGIFGRDPKKAQVKEQKKADKKSCDEAFQALAPWCKKTKAKSVGELQWLVTEQSYFAGEIDRGNLEKKGDNHAVAAQIFQQAKIYAQGRDTAKTLRLTVTQQIESTRQTLAKIPGSNPKAVELGKQLAQAANDLRTSETPKEIGTRVQIIAKDANNLLSGGQTESSPLEKERMKLRKDLLDIVNDHDKVLREKAGEAIVKLNGKDGGVVFPEAEIGRIFDEALAPVSKNVTSGTHMPVDALLTDKSGETDQNKLLVALRNRYDALVTGVNAAAKTVADRIAKEGGKELFAELLQTQKSRAKDVNVTEARKQFLADFQAVEIAMAKLRDMGPRGADALDQQVASDKKLILEHNAYAVGPALIKELLGKIEAATKTAETNVAGTALQLEKDLATLRKELTNQQKSLPSRMKQPYDKLIAELGQLDVIVATNNVNAFGSARQRMAEIRNVGLAGSVASVATINSSADAIALVTADKTVIKEFQSENNELKLAVETTLKELDLFVAAKAAKTFGALRIQADELKKKTESLVAWRQTIKERITAVEGMVKEFKKLLPSEPATTFTLNLAKAKETYETVGVDRAEVDKLIAAAERTAYPLTVNLKSVAKLPNNDPKKIKVFQSLRNDIDSARLIEDGDAQKKTDAETKTKNLKADIKKYNEDLKTAAENVKKATNGDTEELKELQILGEQLQKKMKAGDEEGARKQHDSIRKRLDALIASPGGVTAESVEKLKDVESLWTEAMGKMRTQLDAIHGDAAKAAPAARLDPNDIKKRIDEVYGRFEPFQRPLVQAIRVLADEKSDLKLRKAERENALRDVRSIRTILTGNPMVARLAKNPFGKPSPFKPMSQFLASMEYNALRAVPPE